MKIIEKMVQQDIIQKENKEWMEFGLRQGCSYYGQLESGYMYRTVISVRNLAEFVFLFFLLYSEDFCRWVPRKDQTRLLHLFYDLYCTCIFNLSTDYNQ